MNPRPSRSGRPGHQPSSAGADPVRVQATRILVQWMEGHRHADQWIADFEKQENTARSPWDPSRRRRLRELVFGCVRLKGRYDVLIGTHTHKGPRMRPRLRALLWIALHEICEMNTPPHAVVDEAVKATRALGLGHASSFVNGMLRTVLREGPQSSFVGPDEDPIQHAATWLSHPLWWVQRWTDLLGTAEMLELCAANNRRPVLCVRTLPGERDSVFEQMQSLQWEPERSKYSSSGIHLHGQVPVPLMLQEMGGRVRIQDEAAQMVAPLCGVSGAQTVLDLCASPGGKASHLAELAGPESIVIASDLRMHRIEAGGSYSLCPLTADALQPPFAEGSFDSILVDAPCSGSGVFARRQDARWNRRPEDLQRMPRLQRAILESAAGLLRPGGTLVYSTCSLEPEENEAVVDRFLAEREDMQEIGVNGLIPPGMQMNGRFQAWPHRHGTDGAFAARLRRR